MAEVNSPPMVEPILAVGSGCSPGRGLGPIARWFEVNYVASQTEKGEVALVPKDAAQRPPTGSDFLTGADLSRCFFLSWQRFCFVPRALHKKGPLDPVRRFLWVLFRQFGAIR